jgi:diamine N-acetyltransferase
VTTVTQPENPVATHLLIRAGDLADAELLAELGARTFRDTYAGDTAADDLEAYIAANYRRDVQARELQDPTHLYLVAEVASTPAGFALLRSDVREQGVPGRRPVMLAQIYVDRPFIGRGVGAALMRRAVAEARDRDHDVLGVGVWERNTRAIAFYRRWGFTEVGDMGFMLGDELQRDLVLALWL